MRTNSQIVHEFTTITAVREGDLISLRYSSVMALSPTSEVSLCGINDTLRADDKEQTNGRPHGFRPHGCEHSSEAFALTQNDARFVCAPSCRVFAGHIDCGRNHQNRQRYQTKVYSWGRGEDGQLGLGDTNDQDRPVLVEALKSKGVVQVACGSGHTVVLSGECLLFMFFFWSRCRGELQM